jgi:signal transduction histidine kinase
VAFDRPPRRRALDPLQQAHVHGRRPPSDVRLEADALGSARPYREEVELRRWLGGSAALPARVVDLTITVLLMALLLGQLQTHVTQPGQRPNSWVTYVLAAAIVLPVLTHRRHPLVSAVLALGALVAYSLANYGPYPGINTFVLVFVVALHAERRQAAPVFAAAMAALSLAVWVQPDGVASPWTWISTLLFAVVAFLVGQNLRDQRARWAVVEERERLLETEREERARRAVTAERLRIARELHDVVAHSMSVIAVQAGMGHHVLDTQPEEARRALAAIETTSRAALTEMRRLLGVLRQEGETHAALAPAPGMAELPLLLDQFREAGLDVSLTVSGDVPPTSAPVDLTTYRIVQEALTNTLKHGGPEARVLINHSLDEVYVEVLDNGRPRSLRRATPSKAAADVGHGLIGMRERVAVFGGRLSAGARPGGGYRVAVHLPVASESA